MQTRTTVLRTVALVVASLFSSITSISQTRIHETVRLTPKVAASSQAHTVVSGTFRVEFSYTGAVENGNSDYNILSVAQQYCGISQSVSLSSGHGIVSVEAVAGSGMTVLVQLALTPGSSGVAKAVYSLNGVVIQTDSTFLSCTNPGGCSIRWIPEFVFSPALQLTAGNGSILHAESTSLAVSPVPSQYFCQPGVAVTHPGYPATLAITSGQEFGSFADIATGAPLGTTVTRNLSELGTVQYVANGVQPETGTGTVAVEATSNGITVTTSFTVRNSTTTRVLKGLASRSAMFYRENQTLSVSEVSRDFFGNESSVELEGPLQFEILQGQQWGNLEDAFGNTGTRLTGIPADQAHVLFEARGERPLSDQLVTVRVSAQDATILADTVSFTVKPASFRIEPVYYQSPLYFGHRGFIIVQTIRTDGTAVSPEAGSTYTFEIIEGTEWAALLDGTRRETNLVPNVRQDGGLGAVLFKAKKEPLTPQLVRVKVTLTDTLFASAVVSTHIAPDPITVVATPPVIHPGDTTHLKVYVRNANGSLSEVGPDNFIDFFIHNTDIVGTLISADGSQQDNFFVYGDQPTATFVAAIDSALPDSLVVQIGADANEGSGFGSVLVVRHLEEAPCPVVSLAKQQLSPGDTVAITIMGKKADDSIVPYPASQLFNIGIAAGSGYALIHSTAKGLTNASFDDTAQPFQLVVSDTITVDSVVVQVRATLSSTGSGGGAAPDRSPILAQAKVQGKIGTVVHAVKFLAAFLSDACAVPASGVVRKRRIPTRIDLTLSSQDVISSGSTKLTATLSDGKAPPIPDIDDNTTVNFSMGSEGGQYGSLKNTYDNSHGLLLANVPYSKANNGTIVFAADGQAYDNRFPLAISFGVTTSLTGGPLQKVITGYLKGPHTVGKYFSQGGNAPWAADDYDTDIDTAATRRNGHLTYYTIGSKGCALSCMAMVLKAYGVDVDPGTLNTWMKEHDGFNGQKIKWGVIGSYDTRISIKDGKPDGDGLIFDDQNKVILEESVPLSLSRLDPFLLQGSVALAQVYNTDTKNNHWVVVTGKTSSGDYTILDPGGKTERVTLANSYQNIYKYVPILPK